MKTFKVVGALVILSLFMVTNLLAQSQGKYAYVDLSRLFDEYEKTKEYDNALTEKQNAKEAERNKKIQEIKDMQSKLSLLNDKEKDKAQNDIDTKMKALQDFDRELQTDLRKQRDDLVREILKEIEKTVREYAQKENYTLIFNDRVLLYGDDALNITEPLIKILNNKYTSSKKK